MMKQQGRCFTYRKELLRSLKALTPSNTSKPLLWEKLVQLIQFLSQIPLFQCQTPLKQNTNRLKELLSNTIKEVVGSPIIKPLKPSKTENFHVEKEVVDL